MVSRNDTIDEIQKVKLLDNFNFSTSYNVFNRDSLSPSWAPVNMNGSTRLFNNKLSVSFRGQLDPFGYDDTRNRTTEPVFLQTGQLARLTSASISMGTSFSSKGSRQRVMTQQMKKRIRCLIQRLIIQVEKNRVLLPVTKPASMIIMVIMLILRFHGH